MKEVTLNAEKREANGKGGARRMRASSRIPGVIYGNTKEMVPISFDRHTFELTYRDHFRYAYYKVTVDGNEKMTLIKDIQKDKLTDKVTHVDFFEFDAKKKTTFTVPVSVVGNSPGVKNGGVLTLVKREVKIRAYPLDIPETIEVDVSKLKLGQAFRVRDLENEKYEILSQKSDPLVSVIAPRGLTAEEEEAEAALAADASAASAAAAEEAAAAE